MVKMKGGGPAVPLEQVNISPHELFTFFDQSHTTGMDIKQAVDAKAACTLSKETTLRDHAQAAWRMYAESDSISRPLGSGIPMPTPIMASPSISQHIVTVVVTSRSVSQAADRRGTDDCAGRGA